MIQSKIVDGKGSGKSVRINGSGEMSVVVHPYPPVEDTLNPLPFRQYFTANGKSGGVNDMRVDGSTNPAPFYIEAQIEYDIFIKTISIQISDVGAALDEFGALAALTNGLEFYYFSNELGKLIIHEGIKDNLTMIRIGEGAGVGAGASAFRADISGSGTDTYFIKIDLAQTFGTPWGLRLNKSTTARLAFDVRDNISVGIDSFDIIGYGVKF